MVFSKLKKRTNEKLRNPRLQLKHKTQTQARYNNKEELRQTASRISSKAIINAMNCIKRRIIRVVTQKLYGQM